MPGDTLWVVFPLTRNSLNEGGRERRGEAYLNVNRERFEFLGRFEFTAVTDNGMRFLVRLSGRTCGHSPTGRWARGRSTITERSPETRSGCHGSRTPPSCLTSDGGPAMIA